MRHWFTDDLALYHDDCLRVMAVLGDSSIDAIVTDPPYGLADLPLAKVSAALSAWLAGDRAFIPGGKGFMGKDWDKFVPPPAVWDACFRALKPGGHLLCFASTRTMDLMTLSIRLAGFEVRDSLHWIYGSGFPKGLNVSKAIDKAAGAEREVIAAGQPFGRGSMRNHSRVEMGYRPTELNPEGGAPEITAPATEAARRWDGWDVALKPGHEPIVLARKPLTGTVAANVLAYGTGALNIGACKVGHASPADRMESEGKNQHTRYDNASDRLGTNGIYSAAGTERPDYDGSAGRWPPNVLLTHSTDCQPWGIREVRSDGHHPASRGPGGISTNGHSGQQDLTERKSGTEVIESWDCAPDCPVAMLDGQSGVTKSNGGSGSRSGKIGANVYGDFAQDVKGTNAGGLGDTGGASRFYPQFSWDPSADLPFLYRAKAPKSERPRIDGLPPHPTVKPLALMRWLVRLCCQPGGIVLDPFAGTGPTLQAARLEGMRSIGIELYDDDKQPYVRLARKRLGIS